MRLTPANRRVFISALIVGAGFFVSKVTGILDDLLLAQFIGPGPQLDAYYAAFRLPDLIFALIAGGALAFAFIPVFSGYLTRGDRAGAWKLASAVINTAFMAALIASLVAAIFAPSIVSQFIGRGFTPQYQALCASLMRVILISTVLFSISGIVLSALQANQHFFLPALAPIMYNLGILGGVIFFARSIGVWAPAIGVVIGALLHLLIQVPGLIKYKAQWTPQLGWNDPELRHVVRLLLPRIGGLGVVYFASLVTTSIASTLGEGSVTALDYGWRVMQLPETLIATAIGTAVFPTLSEFAARGQIDQLRNTFITTLRAILALTIPAAIGLLLFGRWAVQILFERGKFTAESTTLVTWVVHAYALGLIGQSTLEVSARTFYAQKDTLTPFYVAVGAMIVNIAANVVLSARLGVSGLALANSIGVTIEVSALLIILRRRLRRTTGYADDNRLLAEQNE